MIWTLTTMNHPSWLISFPKNQVGLTFPVFFTWHRFLQIQDLFLFYSGSVCVRFFLTTETQAVKWVAVVVNTGESLMERNSVGSLVYLCWSVHLCPLKTQRSAWGVAQLTCDIFKHLSPAQCEHIKGGIAINHVWKWCVITNRTAVAFIPDQYLAIRMLGIDSFLVNNNCISAGQRINAANPCFVGGTKTNESQLAAHVVMVAVLLWFLTACLVMFQASFPYQKMVRMPQNRHKTVSLHFPCHVNKP